VTQIWKRVRLRVTLPGHSKLLCIVNELDGETRRKFVLNGTQSHRQPTLSGSSIASRTEIGAEVARAVE
jgi:hypothetical protein